MNWVRWTLLISDGECYKQGSLDNICAKEVLFKSQSCWWNTIETYDSIIVQKGGSKWSKASDTSPKYFFKKLMSFVVLTATFYMSFFIFSLGKGKLFSFFLPNHDFSSLNNKLIDIAKNKSELKIGKIFYCITVLNLPSKPLLYYANTVCIDNIPCWNVDGNSIYGYVWTAFSFFPTNSQAYAIIA